MATLDPQPTARSAPESPTSVQPGGLTFFGQFEMAWGRLRRGWLRRFRPGYVRRMMEKRRGACVSCSHDIVDPRDLKPWRNVCGFSFQAEDDAFQNRDRLGLARHGWAELAGFSVVLAVLCGLVTWAATSVSGLFAWALVPIGFLWLFIISFFRDPKRTVPLDPFALVSPADGTVTHAGEVDDADFPGGRAFRISIFLSVFNVHVNRVPRDGRVLRVSYFRGAFLDARHAECSVRNEQLWIDLEDRHTGQLLRVKQISGAIARRIVCWLKVGEDVCRGDRFGMIKFGSRTEIYLPVTQDVEVLVQVGDKVSGASSTLLRFKPV